MSDKRVVAYLVNKDDPREQFAQLIETTLTDGSKVFDVRLLESEINPATKNNAEIVLRSIAHAMNYNSETKVKVHYV